MVKRILFETKHTCLTFCIHQILYLRGRVRFQVRLFVGCARDALALHLYVYLPDDDKTYSFQAKRVAHNPSFLWSLKRVLRCLFPFCGELVIADGDYFQPKLFHDFHCISFPIIRSNKIYG